MISRFLSKRRPGHVVFVALIALLPVAGVFLTSMNGGQMTDDRAVVQDNADALARMHGAWTARALNTISMNQVAMTQLVSVQIGSEALDGTLTELSSYAWGSISFISLHSLQCPGFSWPPAIAACFAQHAVEARHPYSALSATRRIRSEFDPMHGVRTAHRGLEAFEAMNKAIIAEFPLRIKDLAEDYLDDLDVTDVHFADPCKGEGVAGCTQNNSRDGMALPVRSNTQARVDACAALELGTDVSRTTFSARGFPRLKGPMSYGGSTQNRRLKPHINAITDIWRYLENFKTAHQRMWLIKPGGATKFPQALNLIGSQGRNSNSFTRRFDAKYADACILGGSFPTGLLDLTLRRDMPPFWEIASGSRTNISARGMPPEFKILTYGYKSPNARVGENVLINHSEGQFGYGQTSVYNPEGANMFSQSWVSRLVPADKMDNPQAAGQKLATGARAPFDALADDLKAVQGTGWERIHAH